MIRKKRKMVLSGAVFSLCALLLCVKLTGGALHVLLGTALVVVAGVHMIKNRKRMKGASDSQIFVDRGLTAALVIMILTGLLLHPLGNMLFIKMAHKLSSVVFVLGCIIHMIQHKPGVKKKRRICRAFFENPNLT